MLRMRQVMSLPKRQKANHDSSTKTGMAYHTQSTDDDGFDRVDSIQLLLPGAITPVSAFVTYGYTIWSILRSQKLDRGELGLGESELGIRIANHRIRIVDHLEMRGRIA